MHWKQRVPILAAALWWGSLTAIGLVAVPQLFSHAASPAVAGALAARLFEAQTWLSLVCGVLVLMGAREPGEEARMDWAGGAVMFALLGMLAALLLQFAVAPRIVARQDLAWWHSVGSALYAAQWLCALLVLWKVTSSPPARDDLRSASSS
jgi:hypothetical protein